MRFRFVMALFISVVLLSAANASAQKRLFTTVDPNAASFSDTIDIFDPQTEKITKAANKLNVGRERPVVFQLDSGRRALIVGGSNNRLLRSAEIFNPEDGSVSEVGDMLSTRGGMASVIAPGGSPLIIGGYNGSYLQTLEQYDSVSEKFIMVSGYMSTPRQYATATLLGNGTVLVAGGFNGTFLDSADIYDYAERTFLYKTEVMKHQRVGHSATRISSNRVLIAGGCNNSTISEAVCDNYLTSAEIYDDTDGVFTETGGMSVSRKDHTATDLGDGRVLIVGGMNAADAALASAEIYTPETGVFTPTGAMTTARVNHTATLMPDGRVVIAGGNSASGEILSSVEIYNPADGTFRLVADTMSEARTLHAAIVLNDGKVLFIAGQKNPKLVFDINYQVLGDNIAGNIYFTPDSRTGFAAYTGSGTILAFNPYEEGGGDLKLIETGGMPVHITPILDGQYLAVVSVLDNRIFIINPTTFALHETYSFANAGFGFGSQIALSPDGRTGYISSPTTGEVIKFDVATGKEERRLSGLRTPGQITVTSNGETLFVVDAGANTVKGVNAATMTVKYTFAPQDRYYAALFSIHNKVTLNADETLAIITSQDYVLDEYSAAFMFDPATGEWIKYEDEDGEERGGIYAVGSQPGWTMLMPDGESWLTLARNYVSLIPTIDPRVYRESDDYNEDADNDTLRAKNYAFSGSSMRSSNVELSANERYAFFASAASDQVVQMDWRNGAVIGAYLVGDDPNLSPDQPIAVKFTPDAGILAAMSYATNELNLFVDSYIYRQSRYISQQDRFTGISIINISPEEDALVQVTAMTNGGFVHYYYNDDEMTNPRALTLKPNTQISIDISEFMKLDNDVENAGHLTIDSNLPVIVGFTAVGQIQSSFLTSYIRSMEGLSFFASEDIPKDIILPEIPESSDATTEISIVNPWHSILTYTVTHYGTDGTKQAEQEKNLGSQARESTYSSGITSTIPKSQVLLAGGFSGLQTDSTSEKFDGSSTTFYSPVYMRASRYGHTASTLANGKVLIAGGRDGFNILKTAETFDPSITRFSFTPGSMNVERFRHTATRLLNGMVLLAGGQTANSITRSAELFDFTTGSFSYTKDEEGNKSEMAIPRDAHTATRLADGRVLIAGGLDGMGITKTAEIYDPKTGVFTLLPVTMNAARAFHTATLLGDGKVLLVGGYSGEYLKSAEVFNPVTSAFEPVSDMSQARSNHAATLLSDGMVLITGGRNLETDVNELGGLDTAEIYDPSFVQFSETGNTMSTPRSFHTAVNFMDDLDGINDRVIISGGIGPIKSYDKNGNEVTTLNALSTSDIYTPGTRMFTRTSSNMNRARQGHTAILIDEAISTGYLRFTSDTGLLASESFNFEKGGAPASIDAINMAKYEGVTEIYSPRFVIDDERTTRLNVINGNEDTAEITLELFSDSGSLIASKTHNVAGNAQINGKLADVLGNSEINEGSGWIKVSSTLDQIVGIMTFISHDQKRLGSFKLSGNPMERFIFPLISENNDFETEISFLNAGAEAASMELQLWDVNGNKISYKTVSLAPGANTYGTISDLFEASPIDTGNVRVLSSRPIYGIGEIRAKSGRFTTPVPAMEYKVSEE